MTTIQITRHLSGFVNRPDSFAVGNSEHEGNAAMSTYALPEGYTVADGTIWDAAGFACTLVEDDATGAPRLMSLAGTAPDHVLIEAA